MALGKKIKKNKNLCRVPYRGHSAKKFKNKNKNLCRVPYRGHSAKKFKK